MGVTDLGWRSRLEILASRWVDLGHGGESKVVENLRRRCRLGRFEVDKTGHNLGLGLGLRFWVTKGCISGGWIVV